MSNSTPKHECPHCNKYFINLKQHITKSHNKIIIEVRPIDDDYSVFKIENGIEEEGDTPYSDCSDSKGSFESYEWYTPTTTLQLHLYEDKSFRRTYNDYPSYKKRYTHNISVVFK